MKLMNTYWPRFLARLHALLLYYTYTHSILPTTHAKSYQLYLYMPNHSIKLMIGAPIVLLRNFYQAQNLCNKSR